MEELPQILYSTNTNSVYTRPIDKPHLTLNTDATIILGAKPTYTFSGVYEKYTQEQLDIPTIYAPEDKNVTLNVRGYNGYSASTANLNIYTTATIKDNINIVSIPNQVIIHPIELQFSNSVFNVTNEDDVELVLATSLGNKVDDKYPWDVCYTNDKLYINTDERLRIGGTVSNTIAQIVVVEGLEQANLIFDELRMTQIGGVNMFHASPKNAGTGSNISYGLIQVPNNFYERPDGKLYTEDIILTAGDGLEFNQNEHYNINYISESNEWYDLYHAHNMTDIDMTHKINILGTVNDDRLGGSKQFFINVLDAGEGEGNNIRQGIIDEVSSVYMRPDNFLYLEEDLYLTVDGNKFSNFVFDEITSNTVTITANNGYDGTTTFEYKTAPAGSNSSGTKDLSNGIIYSVMPVYEREGIFGGELHLEDLFIQVNTGEENPKTLTYNEDYTIVLDKTNSKVTLTGISEYYGEISFYITIMPFNSDATHLGALDLVQETIYKRPDNKLYINEDLVFYVREEDGNLKKLNYASDYYAKIENDGTYTLQGIGDYRGTMSDYPLEVLDAGMGTGNSVRKGIIHLADPIEKIEGTDVDINDLVLYINDDGQKVLFDKSNYDLTLNNKISDELVNIMLVAKGEFTDTITFDVGVVEVEAPKPTLPSVPSYNADDSVEEEELEEQTNSISFRRKS